MWWLSITIRILLRWVWTLICKISWQTWPLIFRIVFPLFTMPNGILCFSSFFTQFGILCTLQWVMISCNWVLNLFEMRAQDTGDKLCQLFLRSDQLSDVYTTFCEEFTIFCEAMNKNLRNLFLLREYSRLFFKFYVRSYIRTFISFWMYYWIPTPPKNYFLSGPKNRGSGWACQNLRSNITKICKAILPKFAKQYGQNLRSNMTKNCEANHTLWAVPVCLDAAAHVLRADESPLKESPAEWPESGPEYTQKLKTKTYIVTWSNEKEQDRSLIWRVDFEEPLVTLRTLRVWQRRRTMAAGGVLAGGVVLAGWCLVVIDRSL